MEDIVFELVGATVLSLIALLVVGATVIESVLIGLVFGMWLTLLDIRRKLQEKP